MKQVTDFLRAHITQIAYGVTMFAAGMFMATCAMAGDATVSWNHPTQRTDGSSLPLSSIKETVVEWGLCAGSAFPASPAGTRPVTAPTTTTTVTGLASGTWCFRARTVDTAGQSSDNSNTATKVFVAPPNPPVITVAAGATAYELRMLGNGEVRLGRSVGTMTQDAVCGAEFAPGYFAVPGELVQYDRTPKSSIVVAACS